MQGTEGTLARTPLYEAHIEAGAKMVPFAGFEMPVQYPTGIVAEHKAVRRAAGLFDVSHMGELDVRGPQALDLVQWVTTNDASRLAVGQAQYSVLCDEGGGALDDCIVYRFPHRYMVVVNASNLDKDRDWIVSHANRFEAEVIDRSAEVALIALQGPRAQEILGPLTDADLDGVAYYHFAETRVSGRGAIVSRTGYTGEDGFELYIGAEDAAVLWRALLEAGKGAGIVPAGLGARDSLRLEMGYALYGNDLDERRTPLEAGLGWVVKLDKGEFLGRDALARQRQEGVREKLVGFALRERGFPRHGYEIRWNGEPTGEVTSGAHSPSLERGIGMGYVAVEASKPGTALDVVIRDRPAAAEVVRPPFYKEGSLKR